MSQETPRSSAGVSTPRTYTEIYNNLDIFKETDYQKSLSKSIHNNLKVSFSHFKMLTFFLENRKK